MNWFAIINSQMLHFAMKCAYLICLYLLLLVSRHLLIMAIDFLIIHSRAILRKDFKWLD